MIIERTETEIMLRLPSNIDTIGFQRTINYLKYKETTVNSQVKEDEINALADESKKRWWAKNKYRFIK